jgi:hypothetical protein
MKLLNYIKLTKVNIVYDDDEFTLSRKTKDYLMALLSSSFLLVSYIFNIFVYSSLGKRWGLFLIVPILIITLGYFVVTLVQYLESKRLRDKWFSYNDLKCITIREKGDNYLVDFDLSEKSIKGVSIDNDLYFRQFITLLKQKGVTVNKRD